MAHPPEDHGTYEDAVTFALDEHVVPHLVYEFLEAWRTGNLNEWPAFSTWLEARREAQPCNPRALDWIELGALIEPLREDEASGVTLICDNPNDEPNNAVECYGDWTNWDVKRFDGETLADALRAAVAARTAAKAVNVTLL